MLKNGDEVQRCLIEINIPYNTKKWINLLKKKVRISQPDTNTQKSSNKSPQNDIWKKKAMRSESHEHSAKWISRI